ncbi:MAG TPA: hypothetical protein VHZ33_39640, partial [Trebonia sp.]|nr:hypothetical protein [Trebonia sp.]
MKHLRPIGAAAIAVLALTAAGCSSASSSSASAPASSTAAAAATAGSSSTAAASSGATGSATAAAAGGLGTPHKATGTPYVFGMINDETGAVTFPEARQGSIAAADYVNNYLNGINGHPIQI